MRAGALAAAAALVATALIALDELLVDEGSGPTSAPVAPGRPEHELPPDGAEPAHRAGKPSGTVVWDGLISLAEWEQLSAGLTVAEVGSMIGGAGEIIHEIGELGGEGHQLTVRWPGADADSYATAHFEDGRLVETEQVGLGGT